MTKSRKEIELAVEDLTPDRDPAAESSVDLAPEQAQAYRDLIIWRAYYDPGTHPDPSEFEFKSDLGREMLEQYPDHETAYQKLQRRLPI